MKIKIIKEMILTGLVACSLTVAAQDSAQVKTIEANPLTFSGYVDTYYSYDFANPGDHTRPGFIYSFNRHNEFNLNIGYVKAAYATAEVRANLTLMAGTYPNANLSAEPGVLKNIYEANAGIKVSKKKDLWVDAGIFTSHIGFESAVSKDCWNLTRSVLADNSPYYESGIKLSYTSPNSKWFISGLLLNGWQRIQRPTGNNTPAFGHQVTYKPNAAITLNSSSFIGSDKPDSSRQMRYFHNFYGIFQLTKQLALTAGFDIGAEQKAKESKQFNCWYSPVMIVKISPTGKTNIAVRAEYYSDEKNVIISTGTANGFKTWGYSANFDYMIRPNVVWRIEGRTFNSKDAIFVKDNNTATRNNIFMTTSLAVSF